MSYVVGGLRRGRLALALALAAAAGPVGSAGANVYPLDATIQYTAASTSTCQSPVWTWPYKAIGDSRTYVLAPSGAFTGNVATGWQLRGGARLVSDAARGPGLALPAGASVVSPAMCADLNYPHMRLAHKVVGSGAANVELRIDVVYPQNVKPVWTEVKQFDGFQGNTVASGWRITPDIDVKPDWGGQTAGARYVAFRFTAVKKATTSAEYRIDDVYMDPWMRR